MRGYNDRLYNSPQQMILGLKPSKTVAALLIINSVLFIIEIVAMRVYPPALSFIINHFGLKPASVIHKYEIWQVLTYFWLHSPQDLSHILWNLLTLWLFSGILEAKWGSKNYLKFYLYCGIGAGLTVVLFGYLFDPATPTIGASGAILGLVAAFGILFPNLPVYLFGVFPIKGKIIAWFTVGLNLLMLLVGTGGVSVSAHLGGLVIGALLVTGFWRPKQLRLLYLKWKYKRISKKYSGNNSDPMMH